MIVTVSDAHRAIGRKRPYCNKGMRKFAEKYGLDYPDFVKNGIDSEALLATGDSMAIHIVEVLSGR